MALFYLFIYLLGPRINDPWGLLFKQKLAVVAYNHWFISKAPSNAPKVGLFSHLQIFRTDVVNPRPKKNFLRPKLESKLSVFSIFWMISLCFRQNAAQKVVYLGFFSNAAQRPIWVGHPCFRIYSNWSNLLMTNSWNR
jgi:hypothetical protein